MSEHQQDWETQRERLSAFLDGELPTAERAALEAHLTGCARCAAELGELRQVVGILRALPAARVPRSFTLPAAVPHGAPDSPPISATPTAPTPLHGPARSRVAAGRAPWTGAAQWLGGLATAAGLTILLAGALAGMPRAREASSGAALAPASSTAHSTTFGGVAAPTDAPDRSLGGVARTPAAQTGAGSPAPQTSQDTPTVAPRATPPPVVSVPGTLGTEPPIWPITGGGLLIGGVVVFVVGRRAASSH
ncbi:MAG TPA: zf-HC2 domain-containing protein [Ktedonobacterales bacterium]